MADYYVSTSGNDANNGSQAHPWRHIAYGANLLVGGDTLHVLAGTYTLTSAADSIFVPTGATGTAIARTTIKSETPLGAKIVNNIVPDNVSPDDATIFV